MSTDTLPKALDYLPEEKKLLLRHTIGSRLRLLVTAQTPEKKRFELLERATSIPSATWRTWWRRDGTPSGQLIEAAAKAWPEHAFWLTTGITDVEAGHTMPVPPAEVKGYIDPYPETPFSGKSLADFGVGTDEVVSWATTSENPQGVQIGDRNFGKWPDGAQEFLAHTSNYLRLNLELQEMYWEHYRTSTDKKTKAAQALLNKERLRARKARWTHQLNKNELKK